MTEASKRNYKLERQNYHGTPAQKKKNAARKRARRLLEKSGAVRKGDGRDVHHKDGNPLNNSRKNLAVSSVRGNRSYPRTKTSRKKG